VNTIRSTSRLSAFGSDATESCGGSGFELFDDFRAVRPCVSRRRLNCLCNARWRQRVNRIGADRALHLGLRVLI
jgi:hypothetical protein